MIKKGDKMQKNQKLNFLTTASVSLVLALLVGTVSPILSIYADTTSTTTLLIDSDDVNSLDKYVVVSDNQYKLELPVGYNVDPDVVKATESLIAESNKTVKENDLHIDSVTKVATIASTASSPLEVSLAAKRAKYIEGKTKVELHWNYARIFISKTMANGIKAGTVGAAGVLAGKIPNVYTELAATALLGIVGYLDIKGGFYFDYNYALGNKGYHWQ